MVITDLKWTRHFPLFIVVSGFATILFEIYFPVLIWNQKTRKIVMVLGLFFHLGIGLVMALFSFAAVMLAPYLLFLQPEELKRVLRRFHVSI